MSSNTEFQSARFQALGSLLNCYFHQDYDIYGPEVVDVVKVFVPVYPHEHIQAVKHKINELLNLPDADINLAELFPIMEVDPSGFSGSNRQFLQDILAALP